MYPSPLGHSGSDANALSSSSEIVPEPSASYSASHACHKFRSVLSNSALSFSSASTSAKLTFHRHCGWNPTYCAPPRLSLVCSPATTTTLPEKSSPFAASSSPAAWAWLSATPRSSPWCQYPSAGFGPSVDMSNPSPCSPSRHTPDASTASEGTGPSPSVATPGGHRVQSSLALSVGPTPTIAGGIASNASDRVSRLFQHRRSTAWFALRTSTSTSSTVYLSDPSGLRGGFEPLRLNDSRYSPRGSAIGARPHAAATTPRDATYISEVSNILVFAYDLTTLNASAGFCSRSAATFLSTVSESCLAPSALT